MAKTVDWQSVEREYRSGVRSLRDIGAEFGISHVAIKKHADRDGWVRDLSAKIQAAAEDKVTRAEVTSSVTTETKATERDVIEANAKVIADAVLNQRTDVKRARGIVQKLFAAAEAMIDGADDFEKLCELLRAPDENGVDRLNDIYRKVMALPTQVDSVKKLSESLRVLIELERKVLRINDGSSADDMAKKIGEGAAMSALDAYTRMCEGA